MSGPRRVLSIPPGAPFLPTLAKALIDGRLVPGFRFDVAGRIWTSAGDGVHCYDPDGTLLGKIRLPETVSNLAFGGPKRTRLFITARQSLYSVFVVPKGAAPG